MAFFAFIGFEDIANMAEETIEPRRTTPRAIFWTLSITMVIYVLLALIAAIAAVAMINGILLQIVMASRVLYGMAGEGLIPASVGDIDSEHQTPFRATALVAAAIMALALIFPLVRLAQLTSLVILGMFTLVNLALFIFGRRQPGTILAKWRFLGLFGAAFTISLGGWQVGNGLFS